MCGITHSVSQLQEQPDEFGVFSSNTPLSYSQVDWPCILSCLNTHQFNPYWGLTHVDFKMIKFSPQTVHITVMVLLQKHQASSIGMQQRKRTNKHCWNKVKKKNQKKCPSRDLHRGDWYNISRHEECLCSRIQAQVEFATNHPLFYIFAEVGVLAGRYTL